MSAKSKRNTLPPAKRVQEKLATMVASIVKMQIQLKSFAEGAALKPLAEAHNAIQAARTIAAKLPADWEADAVQRSATIVKGDRVQIRENRRESYPMVGAKVCAVVDTAIATLFIAFPGSPGGAVFAVPSGHCIKVG